MSGSTARLSDPLATATSRQMLFSIANIQTMEGVAETYELEL
jgi:hypothetical protein